MGKAMASRRKIRSRERGAFAVMFVPLLIVIIGFCGLALDMGRLYNRKVDLSGLSKAVALAAARELNGTPEGIQQAKLKARETAERLRYSYYGSGIPVTWSEAALSFGTSPSRSGTWTPASDFGAGSTADASRIYFAKVDSDGLDADISTVDTIFMRILYSSLANIHVQDSAVAGRASINVMPIAVCAMSTERAEARNATPGGGGTALSELVQYGFRRGVSYDLMQLNPNGTSPARYAVNPTVAPGAAGSAFTISRLAPFLCNGTMWVPRLSGDDIRVSPLPSSPLVDLHAALNSRFNEYGGSSCQSNVSPPDANIKKYAYDQVDGVKWMDPALGKPAALTTTARNKLETVADLPDDHASLPSSRGDYGPLWSYARAARAPTPVTAEPSGGYSSFDTASWATLYKSGPATLGTYPGSTSTPYQATTATNGFFAAPAVPAGTVATRHRRVLHIPLLSCSPDNPAGANASARVAAIGKFFMTVPATQDTLIAEFSGLVLEQSLSGEVRLYP
ncbi:pilus assembly protein TadG-related protein [Massilia sp. IC2-476]|uniref:TadE/TadG family type IV pilus assembly protein n=1 Tax=Massilia sp. IC2-476 TaxID=2887199 RepID=UPI0027D96107|nr:pilus assembly protein TadG-related protein [Massilia sp. IC2-476]